MNEIGPIMIQVQYCDC